jgi:hypothetical protein
MHVTKGNSRRTPSKKVAKPFVKAYKGFSSYEEYYKAVVIRPAENLFDVLQRKEEASPQNPNEQPFPGRFSRIHRR